MNFSGRKGWKYPQLPPSPAPTYTLSRPPKTPYSALAEPPLPSSVSALPFASSFASSTPGGASAPASLHEGAGPLELLALLELEEVVESTAITTTGFAATSPYFLTSPKAAAPAAAATPAPRATASPRVQALLSETNRFVSDLLEASDRGTLQALASTIDIDRSAHTSTALASATRAISASASASSSSSSSSGSSDSATGLPLTAPPPAPTHDLFPEEVDVAALLSADTLLPCTPLTQQQRLDRSVEEARLLSAPLTSSLSGGSGRRRPVVAVRPLSTPKSPTTRPLTLSPGAQQQAQQQQQHQQHQQHHSQVGAVHCSKCESLSTASESGPLLSPSASASASLLQPQPIPPALHPDLTLQRILTGAAAAAAAADTGDPSHTLAHPYLSSHSNRSPSSGSASSSSSASSTLAALYHSREAAPAAAATSLPIQVLSVLCPLMPRASDRLAVALSELRCAATPAPAAALELDALKPFLTHARGGSSASASSTLSLGKPEAAATAPPSYAVQPGVRERARAILEDASNGGLLPVAAAAATPAAAASAAQQPDPWG